MTSDMKHRTTPALSELSDAEIESLADAVEAGRPLDYPYFRWTQHMRRYVLFYWTTLLFVMMGIWFDHFLEIQPPLLPKTYHWMLTSVLALVAWWLSPKISDKSLDVQESVRDVVYRLARTRGKAKKYAGWSSLSIVWYVVGMPLIYGLFWLAYEVHLYPPLAVIYILSTFSVLLIFLPFKNPDFGNPNLPYEQYKKNWRFLYGVDSSNQKNLQIGIYGKRKVRPVWGFLCWSLWISRSNDRGRILAMILIMMMGLFGAYQFLDVHYFNGFPLEGDVVKNLSLTFACLLFYVAGGLHMLLSYQNHKTNSICLAIMQIRQEVFSIEQ